MSERTEAAITDIPEFTMPACIQRHFFKGYRWWCRACSREVERQFKDVCIAYWMQKGRSTDA